jgi:hypothetical protein
MIKHIYIEREREDCFFFIFKKKEKEKWKGRIENMGSRWLHVPQDSSGPTKTRVTNY